MNIRSVLTCAQKIYKGIVVLSVPFFAREYSGSGTDIFPSGWRHCTEDYRGLSIPVCLVAAVGAAFLAARIAAGRGMGRWPRRAVGLGTAVVVGGGLGCYPFEFSVRRKESEKRSNREFLKRVHKKEFSKGFACTSSDQVNARLQAWREDPYEMLGSAGQRNTGYQAVILYTLLHEAVKELDRADKDTWKSALHKVCAVDYALQHEVDINAFSDPMPWAGYIHENVWSSQKEKKKVFAWIAKEFSKELSFDVDSLPKGDWGDFRRQVLGRS